MKSGIALDVQAQRLREEFDEAFSRLPKVSEQRGDRFVMLRCAGAKYAVALRDISLFQGNVKIVPVPTSNPGLLGICCVRGEVLAVFGLAAALGQSEATTGSWIIRAAGTTAVFAFEHCEGLTFGEVRMASGNDKMVQAKGELVPLLSLAELVKAQASTTTGALAKEDKSV